MDEAGNIYSFEKNYLSNMKSNVSIEKILLTGSVLSGGISFRNVLPDTKKLTLINLPVNSTNWKRGENVFNDVIQLRDIDIDWEEKYTVFNDQQLTDLLAKDGKNNRDETDKIGQHKKLVSGVDFIVKECQGDSATQTVTVFFQLNNSGKAHQKVNLVPWWGTYVRAIDEYGNDYKFGNVNLGRQYGNGFLKAELPCGLFVNGYVTYTEVEPKSKYLSLVNIPIYCRS